MLQIALLLLILQNANAQSFSPQLAAMLQDTLNTYTAMIPNIKGLAVSVYVPSQGMWQGTMGVSYTGQPITSDMLFGIASNSKLFVSVAVLKLAENGTLSLNDSLHNWLPNYPNINPNITIRQLLNHTSGISDPIFVSPNMDTIQANPNRVFTPNEILAWVGAPLFAPGTSWGYSNVNYILAAMVAQSATGFHISRIIRDSLLTPLDMDSTFYDVEEPSFGTIAHRWWNGVDYHDTARVGLNTAAGAAGAMFSTTSEMAQWYDALFDGRILNAASMQELTTFVATANNSLQYGLGLNRETTQGYAYWGHAGDTWGYRSKMLYDSCAGTVVCGLSNSFPSGMSSVAFLLYRAVKNHIPACAAAINGIDSVCQATNGITFSIPAIPNATGYVWQLPSGATGSSTTNSITVDFDANAVSGEIKVWGTNTYGGGGMSKLWINLIPTPITPVISANINVLTSSASVGNQWYDNNGIIVGATDSVYTANSNGDYYSIVTVNGCNSDTSNIINLTIESIRQTAMPTAQIYPNPVGNQITIILPNAMESVQFQIINTLGQIVEQGTLIHQITLPTHDLAQGIYTLRISERHNQQVIKFIKN